MLKRCQFREATSHFQTTACRLFSVTDEIRPSKNASVSGSSASSRTRPRRHGPLVLPDDAAHDHPPGMFCVSEAEAATIRAAYEQGGELSAAIELRRLFPGITDNARAWACARTIIGWALRPVPVPKAPPRPRKRRS